MQKIFCNIMARGVVSKLSNKAGVSLLIVLMFMLIATIAATATWKWLSSEGMSSASRMLQREAAQSANAGIENARMWMTFNANDVGVLITQYLSDENLDGKGSPRPINISVRGRITTFG